MQRAWFTEYPEEPLLGLPEVDEEGNAPDLTPEEAQRLGEALENRMKRLDNWFRHHSKKVNIVTATQRGAEDSLASLLFEKKEPRHRPLRAIERFQKMYPKEVDAALEQAGFYDTSEGDMSRDLLSLDDDSPDDVKQRQSARMTLRTRVVRAVYSELSDEEKAHIDELVEEEKKEFAERAKNKSPPELAPNGTSVRQPEQYQVAIDEAPEVLVKVHRAIQLKTGWFGMTILGGPNPRYGGGLSMKVVCFGETAVGNDFETAHAAFDDAVSKPFQAFLKRSFPLGVRRARALQTVDVPDEQLPPLDGLFRLPDEKLEPATIDVPKRSKPKRKRKKKAPAGSIAVNIVVEKPSNAPVRNDPPSQFSADTSAAVSEDAADDAAGDNDDLVDSWDMGNDAPDQASFSDNDQANDSHMWPPGMPQPSSPATAGRAAAAERGGLPGGATYVSAFDRLIDPQLRGEGTPLQRPKPRSAYHGAEFYRPVPLSPTIDTDSRFFQHLPKSTSVLGFTFPSTSLPTSSTAPADVGGRPGDLYRRMASSSSNPAATSWIAAHRSVSGSCASPTPSAPGGSSPDAPGPSARAGSTAAAPQGPTKAATTALAILASFPPSTAQPPAPAPNAPAATAQEDPPPPIFINSRPMANPPVVAKAKTVPKAKAKAVPKAKASAAKEKAAAKMAGKVAKVMEKAPAKGRGKAKKRSMGDEENDAGSLDNAAIQPSPDGTAAAASTSTSAPQLIYTTSGRNNTMALNRRADAAIAARAEAERKRKARTFNPDGPTPIVCIPAHRSGRQGQPTRLADNTLAQLPSRGSRADQIRRREQKERDEEELARQLLISPRKRRAPQASGAAAKKQRR
ncbi:hypothetical protein B0H16DRAFT_1741304 [Mycena metata]|uniref:Uncharacterized protein n=1 Tax=Mycena metata TaxID=1033252 RepID=A0AAD7HBB0_9AGAR|nr:hypothetical protein B0H16DRAFT_1741304 [Mycena metata]